jgi:small subunit ribosomal protein S14
MQKKSLVVKNNKKAKLAKRSESKRQAVIAITKNESLSFEERLKAQKKLSEMPRDASKSRYRNRCSLTGMHTWVTCS